MPSQILDMDVARQQDRGGASDVPYGLPVHLMSKVPF